MWSGEVHKYDSGLRQGSTPWVRPLYRYSVAAKNYSELKQSSLHLFWNTQKGMITPFLLKDPYDYTAEAVVQATSTNMDSGDGFFFQEVNSYRMIADSAALYMADPASSQLLPDSHFVMSGDNGYVTVLVPVSSVWTASFEFFRKVAFDAQMAENSPIWNQFSTSLIIQELLPDR
jgi:hypothetical protein